MVPATKVVVEANGEEKPANGHAVVEPHVAEVRNRRVCEYNARVFGLSDMLSLAILGDPGAPPRIHHAL